MNNTERHENLKHNIDLLKKVSGNISDAQFLNITKIRSRTTLHHCKNTKDYVPTNAILKQIATPYGLNPEDLINTKLKEKHLKEYALVFFNAIIKSTEDTEIAKLLDRFNKHVSQIISIFNGFNISIEFLVTKEHTDKEEYTTIDSKLSKQIESHFTTHYNVSNFVGKMNMSRKDAHTATAKNYINYYKDIHKNKMIFISLADKMEDGEIRNALKVRFKRPKTHNSSFEDNDIYDTIKEMSLSEFLEYCDNYVKATPKFFGI